MAIRFSNQTGNFELKNAEKVRTWLSKVIAVQKKTVGNINYLFCDDEYLLQVNRRYLQHDSFTDIITFDYVAGGLVSGDILISVERVGENAAIFGVPFEQELHRVVVHGVLHLLGQGDKSDAEAVEMRHQEEEALHLWDELFHEEQKV